jgi:hypothetical protein
MKNENEDLEDRASIRESGTTDGLAGSGQPAGLIL